MNFLEYLLHPGICTKCLYMNYLLLTLTHETGFKIINLPFIIAILTRRK